MRNLKLQYCKEQSTGVQNAKHLLLQPDIDRNDSETTYFITDSKVYAVVDGCEEPKVVADLPDIVGAEYLQLENAICVATGAGEVLLINPDTLATSEGTYCDVGIDCMAWSPNQEVVAFVTKTKNVVVMTCTYDVIGEQPLDAELASDQQFVNVGWGKKETQFHGTAGKQAAKQSPEFEAPQDVQQLPQNVNIAWRGDGAFFAVSYVASNVGRTFSVYDCEGKLQYTAEKWNGLEPSLAWRPSGNWIALPQHFGKTNKSTIGLFEKNGLRHREFELPFDLLQESIVQLRWSADSDILALHTTSSDAQRIYLYTIGNYHWYLKQVLVYRQPDELAFFHWDNRIGAEHTLHVVMQNGTLYTYRWNSLTDCYMNTAIACVIDGKRLLLTDFSVAVIPPPMCQRVIQLKSGYINAVTSSESHLCLYTSDRELYFFAKPTLSSEPRLLGKSLPPSEFSQIQLANLTCSGKDHLLGTHSVGNSTRILLLDIINPTCNKPSYGLASSQSVNGTVNALSVGHLTTSFCVQTNNGNVYEIEKRIDAANQVLQPARSSLQLSQIADQISKSTDGLVTLRSQQLLQIDGQRIAEDVTSFLIVDEFVAYTQLNTLHFVRLRDRRSVSTRNIERGAKLVTYASQDARLVLQLPRGNLEVISPRVLVLKLIQSLLLSNDYQRAMEMVRKHRINLNIICDHNLKDFIDTVQRFVASIAQNKDGQWLCQFISELQNEDYTLGMYASNYEGTQREYPEKFRVERKVEYICECLCRVMEQTSDPKLQAQYRLPILTAYVKLGKLEQAMQVIWKQKSNSAQIAEQMLKYLLYLVDVNVLYNIALGTYDFGLVLFVAQHSQKDPKEYLPYLNELKSLPQDYCRFKIDAHLKRNERALDHLIACGKAHEDETMEFIKQHTLYGKALVSCPPNSEFHRRVCIAYADHLRSNAHLETASLMYQRGGDVEQALLTARHTLDWQRVLLLAQHAGKSLPQIAQSLVLSLQQKDRHLEAYELLKQFGQPNDKAPLEALLKGHLYLRAIYEAGLLKADGDENLLETLVKPELLEFVAQLEASLSADRELFAEQKQRLLELRKQQAAKAADGFGYGDGEHEVDIDEVDLLSDTSSMHSSRYSSSSRGTGKTFRSSKNRRKHERKLLSLKPGNPFEDIALIDALHNHVTKLAAQQQQQQVHDTCKALLQLHTEDEQAASLQRLYASILEEMQTALDDIWIPELMGGTAQHLTGPNVDYLALCKEQRYALISPLKRFKPQLSLIDWQHGILQ